MDRIVEQAQAIAQLALARSQEQPWHAAGAVLVLALAVWIVTRLVSEWAVSGGHSVLAHLNATVQ